MKAANDDDRDGRRTEEKEKSQKAPKTPKSISHLIHIHVVMFESGEGQSSGKVSEREREMGWRWFDNRFEIASDIVG